jgi:general secretion pathway protein B
MSFILDALRKSEHERQRQAGPSVAELPIARPASRSRIILLVVGVLLIVNLGVLLYYLLRTPAPEVVKPGSAAPARAAAVASPQPPPVRPPAVAETRPAAASQQVRSLTEEAQPEPTARPSHEAPAPPSPALLPPPPQPVAVAPRPAASAPRPAAAPAQEFIPRIDSLPPEATAGLPKLNLELHIYATNPAQRAVFINGHRYREGDVLPGGAKIEAITTDGAVLRYRGQRFLLPRQ